MTGESVVFHPSGQPRVLQSWYEDPSSPNGRLREACFSCGETAILDHLWRKWCQGPRK
ncbi:hypothetical protein T07_14271 [Trichinella nelsoni]|uniref:Uncharacterized protein n=1 Tax=Trichinella nelsoni TaxID=6336 RepID=A0A0V0RY49_9BILA|nr:hypothetical protein T07_14271 [Trichinella nelsoni]